MIDINSQLTPTDLRSKLSTFWSVSAKSLDMLQDRWTGDSGSPVFTEGGRYVAQGWTEWTQGFQLGSLLLQFDATDEERYLEAGRQQTMEIMAPHLTHIGVHDHGFNNVSTYGNLWRLMNEGRTAEDLWQRRCYELALKVSGAVQAARWASCSDGTGYIYSFNGPQSLFVDTIRSLRVLAVAHQLGHVLFGEGDQRISLLQRLVEHARNTARFNVWYGESRDHYDLRGRTAHEAIFHARTGHYRCPSTQQGYSPFSTWTRGLAWAMLGFTEQLEWFATRADEELAAVGGRQVAEADFWKAALATSDFYIEQTPSCGIPYWDTGAPGLTRLGDYLNRPADPFNEFEPVDSSAAAIAAQGLLRLGHLLSLRDQPEEAKHYTQAGLTVVNTLLDEPYLAAEPAHEGLVLHSIYHRPAGWDHVPPGRQIPCGESSMWGDYHARELALYVDRLAEQKPYYTFFGSS